MKKVLNKIDELYFSEDKFKLLNGDTLKVLKKLESNSIDMIFADPPYFLSNDGITCQSGEMVSVNKGDWDKIDSIDEMHQFNKIWLKECQRLLKDNGTIWISGTYHNIYSVGYSLQQIGFKILNNIVWMKKSPPPNLGCRCFTHSNETIIWARKNKNSKHYFNYDLMKEINNNKQMKDIWRVGRPRKKEKKHGAHPTQKPLELLERIILASTDEDSIILDPFNGSGTTGIAAAKLNRSYIGIDIEKDYLKLTEKRYEDFIKQLSLF